MDESIVQVGRDDAHLGSQFEHVPTLAAEETDRGRRFLATSVPGQRILLQREEPHERRLSGAVGAEYRSVLADRDRQRQRVEHARLAENDGRVVQFEEGWPQAQRPAAICEERSVLIAAMSTRIFEVSSTRRRSNRSALRSIVAAMCQDRRVSGGASR